jgi:hypothetical protein
MLVAKTLRKKKETVAVATIIWKEQIRLRI